MREPPPPPAKLTLHPVYGKECWTCYWCGVLLVFTDFAMLGDREVWKCRSCHRFQVVGRSQEIRAASIAADQERTNEATSVGETAIDLPSNMDPAKLALIQSEYDKLKQGRRRPSQTKVHEFCGLARTTVREYWPFVRK